jgi:hypothetical protein
MNQVVLRTKKGSESSTQKPRQAVFLERKMILRYRNSLIAYSWVFALQGHGLVSWQLMID